MTLGCSSAGPDGGSPLFSSRCSLKGRKKGRRCNRSGNIHGSTNIIQNKEGKNWVPRLRSVAKIKRMAYFRSKKVRRIGEERRVKGARSLLERAAIRKKVTFFASTLRCWLGWLEWSGAFGGEGAGLMWHGHLFGA